MRPGACGRYVGDTGSFPVEVGLLQRLPLNLFLFAVVMDESSKSIQGIVLRLMLFANDIVLVDKSKQSLNVWLEKW